MKPETDTDIPGTRSTIETVATRFSIYFMLTMALCGAVLFVAGLVATRGEFLDDLPGSGVLMATGMIAFCLFFPWFTALYFARHLLISLRKAEVGIRDLKARLEDIERPPEGHVLEAAPQE